MEENITEELARSLAILLQAIEDPTLTKLLSHNPELRYRIFTAKLWGTNAIAAYSIAKYGNPTEPSLEEFFKGHDRARKAMEGQ